MRKPINFLADSIEKLQLPALNFNQFSSSAQQQPGLNSLAGQVLGFEVDILGVSFNRAGNKLIVSTQSITAASRVYAQEKLLISTINDQQLLPRCQSLYVHCAPLSWQSRFNHQPKVTQNTSQISEEVTNSMRQVAENQTSVKLKAAMNKLAKTLSTKAPS